jgi:hypothetical protein
MALSDYIYIAAWSDDLVSQGVLGQFARYEPGKKSIRYFTGRDDWKVYATGIDYDNGGSPTCAEINEQIAIANASAGDPFMTSVGWVGSLGSGCTGSELGRLAEGEKNMLHPHLGPCPDAFPQVCLGSIGPTLEWMWYAPEDVTCPWRPGANYREFLIFRLPVSVLQPPYVPFSYDRFSATLGPPQF